MIRTQSLNLFQGEGIAQYFVHREHSFRGCEEGYHVANSQLLVCPKCHETWAMLHFVDDTLTWPVSAFCAACGVKDEWHPVPGSLLIEEGWGVIDTALLEVMPLDFLKREFKLHIEAYQP